MRVQERALARRQLDKRLNLLRDASISTQRPPRGWIKAIREALGMTTRQLAKRIGVVQSRAVDIEKAEVNGSITLDSLDRAARALDCELVYTLVPREPLETMVQDRASALAQHRIKSARHTMALEDQSLNEADEREQVKLLAKKLFEQSGLPYGRMNDRSALWAR